MDKPLISVVVPVYNVEDYLETCVTSLLGQTYPNLEVILVDDASTDHSGVLCDRFAEADSRVRSVRLAENGGVSHARNEGMRRMQGEFLSFVDPDDYVDARMLERLYESLMEHDAGASMCGLKRIGFGAYAVQFTGSSPMAASGREMFCSMLRHEITGVVMAKLYRAEAAGRLAFDEEIHQGEDILFLYHLLEHIEKVSYIPEQLYFYVCRGDSATQKPFHPRQYTQQKVYEFLCCEAAEKFPQLLPELKYAVVSTNVRFAAGAVEGGTIKGKCLYQYLKQFQKNVRRYAGKEALSACPYRKIAAEAALLYVSAEAFWAAAVLYKKLKGCFGRAR